MRRVLVFGIVIGLLVAAGTLYFFHSAKKNPQPPLKAATTESANISQSPSSTLPEAKSIFVPSWALASDEATLSGYDRLFYIGVPATANGFQTSSSGFQNIQTFLQKAPNGISTSLTVQMTNSSTNLAVLNNSSGQDKIVADAVSAAKQNGFTGIALDFELFSLFDPSIPTKINTFVEKFYNQTRAAHLKFSVALYGDTFYRKRPYDVRFIAAHADEIMVMAYDLHKAIGEPGPNFPLSGKEKYGYDLMTMTDDFLAVAPTEKLTVVFGMYGYDWTVDEVKRPVKQAVALSDNEIRVQYLGSCNTKDCVVLPDALSKETEIDYVGAVTFDADGLANSQNHIIWFENEESVRAKQDYLKTRGINSFSYWAAGYF